MYSKIIVPLDGSELSEQALPYAQLIAQSLPAPVELVQAFDILPPGLLGAQNQRVVAQLHQGAQERAAAALEPARQRLEASGLSVGIVTQRGAPADTIVAQASSDPAALVVMCTHGRGGVSRWVMGSVTDKVLHTMPNPMLIVRAAVTAPETALQSVLLPLDGSPLSELAIPHAVSVAAALSAPVTALRITPTQEHYRQQLISSTPEMGVIADFELATAADLAAQDAEIVAAYLDEVSARLAADHAPAPATEHIVHNNIAQAIIERAAAPPSLVAMTTHGRSGVGRVVLGSVTDRVIRHSNTPVLVIR